MPATAFTVTTVMEPVNVYQDSAEALTCVQWDRNAAHPLYTWQASSCKQNQDLQELEPSFYQAKQGMQTA